MRVCEPLYNEGYSQTIDLRSSELPVCSSQCNEDPSVGVEDRKERRKWSPKEDISLISAWLNTSKDPVVGNKQKAAAFWKRIQIYYNASHQLVGMHPREADQCKQRWGRINDQVCKFIGCYEAALQEQRSSQNEDDVMKAAHDIFFSDHGIKFSLDHAWREFRYDKKWSTTVNAKDGGKEKRRKVDDGAGQAANSLEEEVAQRRPPGVKAAKAGKCKRSGLKTTGGKESADHLAKLETMCDIKKMDLELKKEILNKRLFEFFLAKPEPLSENEMALKNKLINELL
ncbi:glutathione S-transferase T3-like [Eutrema salsugineum]|uniref:glutathione S-transferase T3-like n=1 Tax=Eutrema salsugineum TaxID=72664 RepID=UPI000CED117A|nr:glutathione S-transferase T3-like [Eutrema salsugineum]